MLVGYARVSTQEQDLALQLDALQGGRLQQGVRGEGLGRAARAPGAQGGARLHARGRHAGGLEARPPGPLAQAADRDRRGVRRARHRPALAHRGDRHHHRRRQAGVPHLRGPRRVRARRHPRAHPGRPAGGPSARPHRWQAPCPQGQGPGRRQGPAAGSRDHRGRGRQAPGRGAPRPSTAICRGPAPPPWKPEPEPAHADQAGAALLLPDRLAADQPLGPVRARQGPLPGLWPAAWRRSCAIWATAAGGTRQQQTWRDGRGRKIPSPALAEEQPVRTTKVVLAAAHLDHDPGALRPPAPQRQGALPAVPSAARPAGASAADPADAAPATGAGRPVLRASILPANAGDAVQEQRLQHARATSLPKQSNRGLARCLLPIVLSGASYWGSSAAGSAPHRRCCGSGSAARTRGR